MTNQLGTLGGRALVAAVAVLGVSWAVQDGPTLLHQELDNCQIDVRPLEVEDEVMLEAQVYFAEWEKSGADKYGTEFVIHVPNDSLLTLGDYRGEAPSSSGDVIDLDYANPDTCRAMTDAMAYWIDEFDVAWEERTMFLLTMHPHVIGHRSRIVVLEALIEHIRSHDDVWFATHEEIARHCLEQAG